MRGTQNLYGDNKVIYMKVAGLKKGETAHLIQTVKSPTGSGYDTLADEYAVSGNLIKAEISEYEWEGAKVRSIKLYLEDAKCKEVCVLECGMNSIGRNIINTLANAVDMVEPFRFSVYNNKKTEYASIYITQDDTPVGWKYPYETDIKPRIVVNVVRKGGQEDVEEKDYYDLDQWMLEVFKNEVIKRVPKKERSVDPVGDFKETPLPDDEPVVTPLNADVVGSIYSNTYNTDNPPTVNDQDDLPF